MTEAGRLQTYSAPVDPYLEVAGLMKKLDGGPALLFSKVEGHDMPVIGNLLSCQANVEAAFGASFRDVREFVGRALGDPKPPMLVERAPAQEQVHTKDIDIGRMLPALHHTADDAGRYVTAGIVIAKDPDTGVYNASYHRLMLAGGNRAAIQLDFGAICGGVRARPEQRPAPAVVVCIGSTWRCTTPPRRWARRCLKMPTSSRSPRLERPAAAVVKAITQDLLVPAESEIVLEGILKCDEEVMEGPFGEFVAIWRRPIRPVLEVTAITHRDKPINHAINGYGRETVVLSANTCWRQACSRCCKARCRSSPTPR